MFQIAFMGIVDYYISFAILFFWRTSTMPLFIQEQEIAIRSEDESELDTSLLCASNNPPVTSGKLRQDLTEVLLKLQSLILIP